MKNRITDVHLEMSNDLSLSFGTIWVIREMNIKRYRIRNISDYFRSLNLLRKFSISIFKEKKK